MFIVVATDSFCMRTIYISASCVIWGPSCKLVCSRLLAANCWFPSLSRYRVFSLVVAPAAGDSDDMPVAGSSGAASSTCLASLTVTFVGIGVAVTTCKLCGALSSDESPLPGAHDMDEWGGESPWDHYDIFFTRTKLRGHQRYDEEMCWPCMPHLPLDF